MYQLIAFGDAADRRQVAEEAAGLMGRFRQIDPTRRAAVAPERPFAE